LSQFFFNQNPGGLLHGPNTDYQQTYRHFASRGHAIGEYGQLPFAELRSYPPAQMSMRSRTLDLNT